MCGIAGFIDLDGQAVAPALLKRMTDVIRHRGPDDEGYVLIDQRSGFRRAYAGADSPADLRQALPLFESDTTSVPANIGLSHRRFSIIDLSSGGHQPFFDAERSCCLVFNGEIYNYLELREELEQRGVRFATRSDTEVLLEAYKAWGTDCFARFNGFWAVALYDFRLRRLFLSRDRLGKRPLYWTRVGSRIYFGSEIKALLQVPEVAARKQVNTDLIWHWCVDALRDLDNQTFFAGIQNLPAATWAAVDESFPAKVRTYWELSRTRLTEDEISVDEAARLVRETLIDATRLRLRADVPVAFELSGGLDSSTILALAAETQTERLRTYTVRFADKRWNEEPFARAVAKRYNTDYRVIDPPLDGFWNGIGAFTALQEEPYHSPNLQVSQVIWSHMRSEGTKVTLTGSSGDELFAGYSRYYWKAQLENLRHGRLTLLIDNAKHWSEKRHNVLGFGREMVQLLGVRQLARQVKKTFHHLDTDYLVNVPTPSTQYYASTLTQWLHSEITNTLIPYWLMSGDKTLMGVPFEGRCPFLDYRMVEIAARLPIGYLIRHGWHKWILRKAMERYLPENVVWRKVKMGFPYPYERFYGAYRPIVETILNSARNPYVDLKRKELLRANWKALSFLLWYELFFNENHALFERIERMSGGMAKTGNATYRPEFLKRPRGGVPPERKFA